MKARIPTSKRPLLVFWLLATAFAPIGCGGAPDATASKETAKVKGKISLEGKPLAKVEVRFDPTNVNRKDATPVKALTGDDGTYELTTLVGQNQVSLIGGGALARNPLVAYFSRAVDVQSGPNNIDIDIK